MQQENVDGQEELRVIIGKLQGVTQLHRGESDQDNFNERGRRPQACSENQSPC